jgi:hypothetical protein
MSIALSPETPQSLTSGTALLSTCAEAALVVTDLFATTETGVTDARMVVECKEATRATLRARENILVTVTVDVDGEDLEFEFHCWEIST